MSLLERAVRRADVERGTGACTEDLGERGRRVPTRRLPDFAMRLAARFRGPAPRESTPAPGRRNRHSTEKAARLLGRQPRPARQTVRDRAESLPARGAMDLPPAQRP
ncbi:hypothetical protein ABTY98_14235 [Streptomyces sp. NPDC096040]|uniref:hypothetical protein n=1 Tax=Streptomyces sp. NPDC096040 TaxID=3155541 RepID=UPI00332A17B4